MCVVEVVVWAVKSCAVLEAAAGMSILRYSSVLWLNWVRGNQIDASLLSQEVIAREWQVVFVDLLVSLVHFQQNDFLLSCVASLPCRIVAEDKTQVKWKGMALSSPSHGVSQCWGSCGIVFCIALH